jgi:hypothetical protein
LSAVYLDCKSHVLASPSPPVPEYHQLLPPGGDPVNYSPPFPAPSYSHHHLQQQQHHQLPPDYSSPEVEYKPHPHIQQQQQQQQQQDPLSVEHYRSQFIKEGLKLKVQQKLKEEPIIRDSIDGEPDIKPETEVRGALSFYSFFTNFSLFLSFFSFFISFFFEFSFFPVYFFTLFYLSLNISSIFLSFLARSSLFHISFKNYLFLFSLFFSLSSFFQKPVLLLSPSSLFSLFSIHFLYLLPLFTRSFLSFLSLFHLPFYLSFLSSSFLFLLLFLRS